jgi:nucleotide-binding universal stress UspA family protein
MRILPASDGSSDSLAVARYAPCPVAIVHGRPRQVRRILVAVDGSEGSRAALRFLSIFELVRDTRVSLLHVRWRTRPRYSRKFDVPSSDWCQRAIRRGKS